VLEHSILLEHSVLFTRLFGLVAIFEDESKELKLELDVIYSSLKYVRVPASTDGILVSAGEIDETSRHQSHRCQPHS